MFVEHFQMIDQPFCERISVDKILKDDRITRGMARLQYLAMQANIALVTGPTGVGKSTLLKLFFNSLTPNRYNVVYLHLTNVASNSLLKLIASGLGEMPKMSKDRVFTQILDKTSKSEQTVILLLDEAHYLSSDALTDLRLLVSSALDETPPLKILMVGQEPLAGKLKQSCHQDMLQRINIRYQLRSLTQAETVCYIDSQMLNAGGSDKIFEPEVKRAIFDYTHGIPRQINNIATACLLNAASQKVKKINENLFTQTMTEFQIL